MGYTHHWNQSRTLTPDEWVDVKADLGEILKYIEHAAGIPLADGMAQRGTTPEVSDEAISFNGAGDDGHETFLISRAPDETFCKTASKPYDLAVTACLCYLSSCIDPAAFHVTSDGHGRDFLAGLEAAKAALPRKANVLDIPMGVMERDRWTGPWVNISGNNSAFDVAFCVDGRGYVMQTKGKREVYCFATHRALGEFLEQNKVAKFARGGTTSWGSYPATESDIWNASGSFDVARHARIARAQSKVLCTLFPVPIENNQHPPAFVRPNEFLDPREEGTFCYDLAELLGRANT